MSKINIFVIINLIGIDVNAYTLSVYLSNKESRTYEVNDNETVKVPNINWECRVNKNGKDSLGLTCKKQKSDIEIGTVVMCKGQLQLGGFTVYEDMESVGIFLDCKKH